MTVPAGLLTQLQAELRQANAAIDDLLREKEQLETDGGTPDARGTTPMTDSQAASVRLIEIELAQARAALLDIAEGRWNTGSRSLDIPAAPPYRDAREYARAALDGGTATPEPTP